MIEYYASSWNDNPIYQFFRHLIMKDIWLSKIKYKGDGRIPLRPVIDLKISAKLYEEIMGNKNDIKLIYMLPQQFKLLETIGTLPKIVDAALQYLGLRETPGHDNNPVIMDMAKTIGAEKIYTDDSAQAWCAVFLFFILKLCGKPWPNLKGDVFNVVRAKTFLGYGVEVAIEDIRLGDIVVLNRDGGHHVTIFIGRTKANTFWGLGGNQSNKVGFSEFEMDRIAGVRRFYATGIPASAQQYIIDSDGHLSTNEK